ncbi:exosortase/archaeosortase family protein [Telmatocola sphagniphila]|uniref:Exosortase/archaeosortase family protein n=1 Tax=Telmatocola sphagniphila TaxID=1123043 RepID=A0A8E6B4U1_9BACT|nr:exosortase/archaeosortase family protein [Telmatocola sphagniphila]QVL30410.1 exosortase/archaeosortase family protein [Telmatocola sphagniphila]
MRGIGYSLLAAVGAWAFWPTLRDLAEKWQHDPQYSHGLLVPFFVAYLIHRKREDLKQISAVPSWPLSLLFLSTALGCRATSAIFDFLPLDGLALILVLAGAVSLIQGKEMLKTVAPALGFLLFALPLPYSMERWLSQDLQHLATLASTYLLQAIGQPAINEGNVILIDEIKLGIVEACSGLRMLMTFAAFATGITLLIDRSWATKTVLILSAIPIALIVNVLRISATGLAYVLLREAPERQNMLGFIHDFNGWMMMPVALVLFGIELKVLQWLLVEPEKLERVISFPIRREMPEVPARKAA